MSKTEGSKEQIDVIKKKLRGYIHLRFESEKLTERLMRLKSAEVFPTSSQGEGGGSSQPNPYRQENAILRCMEHETKMAGRIAEIQTEMNKIDRAIDSLKDPLEREVLRERYIDCDNNRLTEWKVIALDIYGDDDEKHLHAIHRLHGRALLSLFEIMRVNT